MRNLRHRYSYQQRLEYQETIDSLRFYLMPLLLKRQKGLCNMCKKQAKGYDIDHIAYNPMISLDHVQLLCWPCHKSVTNFTPFRNR